MNNEIMLYNKILEVSKNYFYEGGIKSLKMNMSKRDIAQKQNTNIAKAQRGHNRQQDIDSFLLFLLLNEL